MPCCVQFLSGTVNTSFIDTTPELFKFEGGRARAQPLLYYMAQVLVNGPMTPLATNQPCAEEDPILPTSVNLRARPKDGWKQVLDKVLTDCVPSGGEASRLLCPPRPRTLHKCLCVG